MSKYVIGEVTRFEGVYSLDTTGLRKSLDGTEAVLEIEENDTSFSGDVDVEVLSHADAYSFLNDESMAGIWYPVE